MPSQEKKNIHGRTKTQTIKVYGKCGMCKNRIEKAASGVDGMQSAVWDENTKNLTVKYSRFKKETVDNVQKKIAAAGHETRKYNADDAVYQKLPGCCHYDRKAMEQ